MSELPFEQLRKESKKALEAYMKSRGPHGKKDNSNKIEVAANPGHGYGMGTNKDSGGN